MFLFIANICDPKWLKSNSFVKLSVVTSFGRAEYVLVVIPLTVIPRSNSTTPFCTTSTFKASYFNRIVKIWNLACNVVYNLF
jgi:hypothetical protein